LVVGRVLSSLEVAGVFVVVEGDLRKDYFSSGMLKAGERCCVASWGMAVGRTMMMTMTMLVVVVAAVVLGAPAVVVVVVVVVVGGGGGGVGDVVGARTCALSRATTSLGVCVLAARKWVECSKMWGVAQLRQSAALRFEVEWWPSHGRAEPGILGRRDPHEKIRVNPAICPGSRPRGTPGHGLLF